MQRPTFSVRLLAPTLSGNNRVSLYEIAPILRLVGLPTQGKLSAAGQWMRKPIPPSLLDGGFSFPGVLPREGKPS